MITTPEEICAGIRKSLVDSDLFAVDSDDPNYHWRISPEPYFLSSQEFQFFADLGSHLLAFYKALNLLYQDSVREKAPGWVADYLDRGKPSDLTDYGRMKRFRNRVPGIIRPDVIVRENGFTVTELDSVPGGFGLTARLMELYSKEHSGIIGEEGPLEGLAEHFYSMVESFSGGSRCTLAIVVSDEAGDYLKEMRFLGNYLKNNGLSVYVVRPNEIIFKEEGLFVIDGDREVAIDVIYRFFELFDLKNVPKSELMMFANKKGRVKITPPFKPYLEEKLSFALFHHPVLQDWWEKALGPETFEALNHLIPSTWLLDNRPLPPHATIPGLKLRGNGVADWRELESLTQKERELVIKPSGFSPEAWGSRGVVIGHDVSSEDWREALSRGLAQFDSQPHILQKFHKGKRVPVAYWEPMSESIKTMETRVRLTPYYFVVGDSTRLGGILATLCPHDKKKIHGMVTAVMVPCAVQK